MNFLALPSELRGKIYHHLFSDSQLHIAWTCEASRSNSIKCDIDLSRCPHEIVLVCHVIREEALLLLAQRTTLHCEIGDHVSGPLTLPVPDTLLSQVRALSITFDRGKVTFPYHVLSSLSQLYLTFRYEMPPSEVEWSRAQLKHCLESLDFSPIVTKLKNQWSETWLEGAIVHDALAVKPRNFSIQFTDYVQVSVTALPLSARRIFPMAFDWDSDEVVWRRNLAISSLQALWRDVNGE